MDFVIHNLRLKELVAIARENKRFYDDFVAFIHERGYASVLDFIQEPSDARAAETISELYIYIKANPNQPEIIEPLLNQELQGLAPLLQSIATARSTGG